MEDEWTQNANEALTISLVRPSASSIEKVSSFNPRFTYPIFGEEERIFGYKGLKVNLQYDARNLRPHLSISSSKKFNSVGEVEAVNVRDVMKEFLPGVAFQTRSEYEKALKDVQDTWAPPGTLVKTTEKNGETYEIWRGTLADPAVKQLIRRVQITVLFFIEGGSYIGIDADGNDDPEYSLARWTVFLVYKKQASSDAAEKHEYIFQGFSTVYDFWMYQLPLPPSSTRETTAPIQPRRDDSWELPQGDLDLANLPRRARISQFIILPPYQGKGIGALLYDTIFDLYMADESTKEITVEDPNEDFDLLRDICDLKYLRKNVAEFTALKVNSNISIPEKGGLLHNNTQITSNDSAGSSADGIVDVTKLEEIRLKAKMAPRQFWRLVEMHLMSTLPASVQPQADAESTRPLPSKTDQKMYSLWRLLLKQRIYRRNVLLLSELETTERIIKLNETVNNVEWEYARILERVQPRSVATNGKRKSDGETDSEEIPYNKKARVDDA
ncbi:histone acetyltransferase type B catalytic subunit [Xylaria bambusicola]|uniref:histone acetyltransferase type B catalytic subunit n=1 Tax=Xylaria bambusicola TaxID=326684 RepID=UPI0020077BCD|nr:histone acetyltransferase type B catalytic subunit [Xylaria bambusicola]KAI0526332.1 histone acetyltransferase type B catalytic subunit [Xylaria bambusicola]